MVIVSNFVKKSLLLRRIAVNLAPCSCAAEVEYSRILPLRTRHKTRHCRALHPPIADKP